MPTYFLPRHDLVQLLPARCAHHGLQKLPSFELLRFVSMQGRKRACSVQLLLQSYYYMHVLGIFERLF